MPSGPKTREVGPLMGPPITNRGDIPRGRHLVNGVVVFARDVQVGAVEGRGQSGNQALGLEATKRDAIPAELTFMIVSSYLSQT